MSARGRWGVVVVGLALLAAPGWGQSPEVFGAATDVVSVDVSVARDGVPVPDLSASDFEVRDQGRLQSVELVSGEAAGLHVVLLLDRSQSMRGVRLAQLVSAARSFLAGLAPADRVTLLAFDYRVSLRSEATTPALAMAQLDALEARGPTALRDALWAALELASPALGRPVVVLFTDGVDAVSWLGEAELLAGARRSEASVYAVLEAASGTELLQQICSQTGGRVLDGAPGPRLDAAFAAVLSEVKHRYVLRYAPDDRSPGWHALDVRLKRGRGLELRARRGYERSAVEGD